MFIGVCLWLCTGTPQIFGVFLCVFWLSPEYTFISLGNITNTIWLSAKRCARKEDRGTRKLNWQDVSNDFFFNEHMWSHPPVKGEGSAALHFWEIWLSVWFVTRCWTLHIRTSPHHCATNHAVNCENPTDLTRCGPHEYYQVNCCCSVSQNSMLLARHSLLQ